MWREDFGRGGAEWSRAEDKMFERALVKYPEETPDRWERVATEVPGRAAAEVRDHYQDLLHDVAEIDSGRVQVPSYSDEWGADAQISFSPSTATPAAASKARNETERKKGVPWTEEEHRLFLLGLQKYGKGDWRSISRNAVVSRTPTQVASHAQKYYLRMNSVKKEKKRSSIHDITTVQTNLAPGGPTPTEPKLPNLTGQPQPMGAPYMGHFRDRGSLGHDLFGFPM